MTREHQSRTGGGTSCPRVYYSIRKTFLQTGIVAVPMRHSGQSTKPAIINKTQITSYCFQGGPHEERINDRRRVNQ